jgi:hypothetical protein
MPSDSPSTRGSSNYEAVIILRMEENNTQAKAKQAFIKDTVNEISRELRVLDNRLAIT